MGVLYIVIFDNGLMQSRLKSRKMIPWGELHDRTSQIYGRSIPRSPSASKTRSELYMKLM